LGGSPVALSVLPCPRRHAVDPVQVFAVAQLRSPCAKYRMHRMLGKRRPAHPSKVGLVLRWRRRSDRSCVAHIRGSPPRAHFSKFCHSVWPLPATCAPGTESGPPAGMKGLARSGASRTRLRERRRYYCIIARHAWGRPAAATGRLDGRRRSSLESLPRSISDCRLFLWTGFHSPPASSSLRRCSASPAMGFISGSRTGASCITKPHPAGRRWTAPGGRCGSP
jgi:hypothetical protein